MKIAFIGAGAIGGLFGGLLHSSGHQVVFIDREHKIPTLSSTGLKLEMSDSSIITVKPTFKPSLIGLKDIDVCIVTVKAYDTISAINHIVDANLKCPVILLQNGLGVEEEAENVLGRGVARGVTNCGAMVEELGVVRVRGIGKTILGAKSEELLKACFELVDALKDAGLPAKVTRNVEGAVWTKTIINSSINPLGTLMNMRNGELIENEHTRALMAMVATEGWRVASELNVKLEVENPVEEVFRVAKATYNNKNSMLMDILRGKRTEIDYINGAIWKASLKTPTDASLNRTLYLMVKALESSKIKIRT